MGGGLVQLNSAWVRRQEESRQKNCFSSRELTSSTGNHSCRGDGRQSTEGFHTFVIISTELEPSCFSESLTLVVLGPGASRVSQEDTAFRGAMVQ